jgi:hypothetical protein
MKTNLKLAVAAALPCLGLAIAYADPVGQITTFTANTTAKASEVNANFSAIVSATNNNDSRIGTLEGVNASSRLTALENGAASPNITGNLSLVPSTATAGNILKGSKRFLHDFGAFNVFVGSEAGNFTMSGTSNSAFGFQALRDDTSGGGNTAVGDRVLQINTMGNFNTAIGANTLLNNTIGNSNTALGGIALSSNTTGDSNTAVGVAALGSNTAGFNNTADGSFALNGNTTGSNNIAIGSSAGQNLTTGSGNIDIGNAGVAAEAQTIRIGDAQTRAFVAGIRGVTTANADAVNVVIDSTGQLGTLNSSRRVKDDIADMGEASRVLMRLRPVTFHYKSDANPWGRTLQYGLVAEEVAKVSPGLVAHSADGGIETVYYQFLAPMLVNEFQRQQRTIEAQGAEIAELKRRLESLATAPQAR